MGAPIQIFAWGNRGRQDDGVGLALAEELERTYANDERVRVQQFHQLGPELADDLNGCDLAVFLDAHVEPHAERVVMTRVTPAESGDLSSHHCRPDVLLALGQALGIALPEACLISVQAESTDFGDQLSDRTARAMQQAKQMAVDLIGSWCQRRTTAPRARSRPQTYPC